MLSFDTAPPRRAQRRPREQPSEVERQLRHENSVLLNASLCATDCMCMCVECVHCEIMWTFSVPMISINKELNVLLLSSFICLCQYIV